MTVLLCFYFVYLFFICFLFVCFFVFISVECHCVPVQGTALQEKTAQETCS